MALPQQKGRSYPELHSGLMQSRALFGAVGAEEFFSFLLMERLNRIFFMFSSWKCTWWAQNIWVLLHGTECAWLGLSTPIKEFTRLGCILSWLLSGMDIMDLCWWFILSCFSWFLSFPCFCSPFFPILLSAHGKQSPFWECVSETPTSNLTWGVLWRLLQKGS